MALLEARRVSVEVLEDSLCGKGGNIVPAVQKSKLSSTGGHPVKKGARGTADLARLIGSLRSQDIGANSIQIAIPATNDDVVKPLASKPVASRKYSFQALLDLRPQASSFVIPVPELRKGHVDDAHKTPGCEDKVLLSANAKNKKVMSFHTDLEVDACCTVNAYNLDRAVEWPNLQTFCAKTVGISPVTIRMMRRTVPAQALIVFKSQEEAEQFVQQVPAGIKLKGRKPRFELSKALKSGPSDMAPVVACSVANEVDECHGHVFATAVVCESEDSAPFKK